MAFYRSAEDLKLYEYDGGVDKLARTLVVFPRTTEDVVAIVKLAREHQSRHRRPRRGHRT